MTSCSVDLTPLARCFRRFTSSIRSSWRRYRCQSTSFARPVDVQRRVCQRRAVHDSRAQHLRYDEGNLGARLQLQFGQVPVEQCRQSGGRSNIRSRSRSNGYRPRENSRRWTKHPSRTPGVQSDVEARCRSADLGTITASSAVMRLDSVGLLLSLLL